MKIEEYPQEIRRVKQQLKTTTSEYRRRDLLKYLHRLRKERNEYMMWQSMARKKADA